ncbi:MAG: protein kinase [Planctomycetota bacterium]
MDDAIAQRALAVFEAALDRPEPERDALVAEACAGHPALAARVRSLLTAHAASASFLAVSDDTPAGGSTEPAPTMIQPQPGVRLGDFRIEALIGSGGMAQVFRATQQSLGRTVALKVMPPHLHLSPRNAARFEREVQAAARVHHTNLVGVYAAGHERGLRYYAMELIEGPTLGGVLRRLRVKPILELRLSQAVTGPDAIPDNSSPSEPSGDLTILAAIVASLSNNYFDRIAEQIAAVSEAVHEAHEQGVLHRDIKPSNLLYSREGRLHLGDFGLAKLMDEPGLTQTGDTVGTPYYMAPEQLATQDRPTDRRTDVYALGATLYEMLTLLPPYPGQRREQVLAKIARDEPRPPRRINPSVPRDLETIALKALARRPRDRYGTAAELAEDLRRFTQRHAITARRPWLLTRGLKLAQRHPATAAALAVALILASSSAYLANRASVNAEQRMLAERELDQAETQALRVRQTQQEQLFQSALIAMMQGDRASARDAARRAEQLGATPTRLKLLEAALSLHEADFTTAVQLCREVVESEPDNITAYALISEAYARRDLRTESRKARTAALSRPPRSVEEAVLLGRMESYHDLASAERILDRVVKADRAHIVARLIRGAVRSRLAYRTLNPIQAKNAIEDLLLASELLPETSFILSRLLRARLIAASAYSDSGDHALRDLQRQEAAILVDRLSQYSGEYEAHRWRAYYFDQIGDLDQAIREWQSIDDKTIGFLAMTLIRAGRLDEARAACLDYRQRISTSTPDFGYAVAASAQVESRDAYLETLRFDRLPTMGSSSVHRHLHVLWCLAGLPTKAEEEVRNRGLSEEAGRIERTQFAFLTGAATAQEYLDAASGSRDALAEAHAAIGIKALGEGRRLAAREHLLGVLAQRRDFEFVTALSKAVMAQLDRDSDWPRWIR